MRDTQYDGFAKIPSDLAQAKTDLEAAEADANAARSRETSARNRVNEMQKKFDAAVAEIRKGAPRDSDWFHDQHHRRIGAVGV